MLPSVDRPAALIEASTNARRESFPKLRSLAWLPVLLVRATAKAVAFAAGFHLLLFMCIWSYAKTTVTAIPDVPPAYLLSVGEEQALSTCENERARHGLLEMLASERGVVTQGADGCARYCESCHLLKPDRCHHCSTCR
ncbi:hypothetical protein MTO96_037451, partial [Rhipicephalus appendiculatus]